MQFCSKDASNALGWGDNYSCDATPLEYLVKKKEDPKIAEKKFNLGPVSEHDTTDVMFPKSAGFISHVYLVKIKKLFPF